MDVIDHCLSLHTIEEKRIMQRRIYFVDLGMGRVGAIHPEAGWPQQI
jgi:hypothetical protein